MKKLITLGCLATVFTMGYPSKGKCQEGTPAPGAENGDRKVRIEITTKENGTTERVTREFDLTDEQALEDALRELGVFDEMRLINDGENLVIDLKRLTDDGSMLKDMCMALSTQEAWDGGNDAFLGVYGGDIVEIERTVDENGEKKEKKKVKGDEQGALIHSVIEDTPAEEVGLQDGDVILSLGGTEVKTFEELRAAVDSHQPGDEVEVTYSREGKRETVKATLAKQETHERMMMFEAPGDMEWEMPDMENFDWEGLEGLAEGSWSTEPRPFLGVDGEDAEGGGARINEVIEGTNAESMGIEEGDVIKKLNGVNVLSFETLAEMIGEMEPGASVAIEVERDGTTSTMNGTLGQQEMPTWTPAVPGEPGVPGVPGTPGVAPTPPMLRIPRMAPGQQDQLRREMDALREEMGHLRHELRGEVMREIRVVVTTLELTREETDVLVNKGVTGLDATWEVPSLRCFPNPSSGSFHLEFDVPERGDLNVDIHDAKGDRIYHETITGFKGRYERTLDLNDQADGSYYLVLNQSGKSLARKLVKE